MQVPLAALQERLTALFREVRPDLASRRPAVADRIRDAMRRITAELVLDTGLTPQITGLRGVEGRTRQLAFVSDLGDLDLEVTPIDGGYTIAGQLGMDSVPAGLRIRFVPVVSGIGKPSEATVLENGHFTVELTPGEWDASVEIDDAVLQFPGIRL